VIPNSNKHKTTVYPVFLPQWGCPHQCVYCNQRVSTSEKGGAQVGEGDIAPIRSRIDRLAEEARGKGVPGELAFYGGTFTSLPLDWLETLLNGVLTWTREGTFSGIRFSTRPDALSSDMCSFLDRYPVQTVELGVQSLSDDVLRRSLRGYSAQTVVGAVRRVRERGWTLGLQLMAGLPGDTRQRFLESVDAAMDLAPDFVRIYPTVVLKETLLAQWQATGRFRPLTLEEAVEWCTAAYDRFLSRGIPVVRMGLHPDPELLKPGVILGGPFHPAFGYLVRVRWWRNRIDHWCMHQERSFRGKKMVLSAAREVVSEIVGPGRENVAHWETRWGWTGIGFELTADRPGNHFEICVE
jgi:histone acetyltransferase (RNA polymerase elongator complex component)